MGFARTLGDAIAPVVDFVYPPRCPACGEGIGAQGGLCLNCWDSLTLLSDPAPGNGVLSSVVAATAYDEVSRQLILAFKHGKRIALAPLLAGMIARNLPDDADVMLVPVPLHRTRLWQRGFNQSALLARELARLGKGRLIVDGLLRTRRTPSLGGLGTEARHAAVRNAISINPRRADELQGRSTVLVDDVYTTGATASAAAQALRKAGARDVTLACFAKVLE